MSEHSAFWDSESTLYILDMYERYLADASSVPQSWQAFFAEMGASASKEMRALQQELALAKPQPRGGLPNPLASGGASTKISGAEKSTTKPRANNEKGLSTLELWATNIIDNYRRYGHFAAALDPLGLNEPAGHAALQEWRKSLNEDDLQQPLKKIKLGRQNTIAGIVDQLERMYCGSIGYEYMHVDDPAEVAWWERRIEQAPFSLAPDRVEIVLQHLIKAEQFEAFLAKKFPAAKRFGLEGCEALIPVMFNLLARAARDEAEHAVIGMAHRGRLNVLCNVLGFPFEALFQQFKGEYNPHTANGDVKYHLGFENRLDLKGHALRAHLMHNPSHLEAVYPVMAGYLYKLQQQSPKALGVCVHGDASVIGQGVVAETQQLSQLEGYATQGIVHLVLNNQVGFTASAQEGRTAHYCTDVAKAIGAPVLHVNARDISKVMEATWLAYEYRKVFGKDVYIDLVGYRKNGHNESDEPAFTQPNMYSAIKKMPSIVDTFVRQQVEKGNTTGEMANKLSAEYGALLQERFEHKHTDDGLHDKVPAIAAPDKTGWALDGIKELFPKLVKTPAGFALHKRLAKLFEQRLSRFEEEGVVDWAGAEQLAYATLLVEGTAVRLSGQDVVRGTFSHRHVGVVDQKTGERYFPLNDVAPTQAKLSAYNSILSEFGVLGFEYGVSLPKPQQLVIWEAQFGDFANGAQTIVDQFIVSAEVKWGQTSNVVLQLPHGYEGQGPEHSSARLERFLELCAQDNMRVVNLTLPANLFHLLRHQARCETKKPLIIMSPKSLLRHGLVYSPVHDFSDETGFRALRVPDEQQLKRAEKLIFCSGKMYIDLLQEQQNRGDDRVALVAVEQLYPLPLAEMEAVMAAAGNADVCWCQEEPQNMGAWRYMREQLTAYDLRYIGRELAASTATGYPQAHKQEVADIFTQVFKNKKVLK